LRGAPPVGETRPLAGKRVVVTRAPEQSGELIRQLEELGAEVLHLPVVRYEPPLDSGPLERAVADLASFDWLILTSQNAVRFFTETVRGKFGMSLDSGVPLPRVAAVGPATAAAAREAGWEVAYIAGRFEGKALAAELGERVKGCKVLLPRSDRARADLPELLRANGAQVTEVVAYRTIDADLNDSVAVEKICAGQVDSITFASPSAFHALVRAIGPRLREVAGRVVLVAIGPVTAEAIKAAGYDARVVADESTAGGLTAAIADYFRKHRLTTGATSR